MSVVADWHEQDLARIAVHSRSAVAGAGHARFDADRSSETVMN